MFGAVSYKTGAATAGNRPTTTPVTSSEPSPTTTAVVNSAFKEEER